MKTECSDLSFAFQITENPLGIYANQIATLSREDIVRLVAGNMQLTCSGKPVFQFHEVPVLLLLEVVADLPEFLLKSGQYCVADENQLLVLTFRKVGNEILISNEPTSKAPIDITIIRTSPAALEKALVEMPRKLTQAIMAAYPELLNNKSIADYLNVYLTE